MTDRAPQDEAKRHWELMMRLAPRPGFCCCCIWVPSEDRHRARRIFRIVRKVTRAWEKERAGSKPNAKSAKKKTAG